MKIVAQQDRLFATLLRQTSASVLLMRYNVVNMLDLTHYGLLDEANPFCTNPQNRQPSHVGASLSQLSMLLPNSIPRTCICSQTNQGIYAMAFKRRSGQLLGTARKSPLEYVAHCPNLPQLSDAQPPVSHLYPSNLPSGNL